MLFEIISRTSPANPSVLAYTTRHVEVARDGAVVLLDDAASLDRAHLLDEARLLEFLDVIVDATSRAPHPVGYLLRRPRLLDQERQDTNALRVGERLDLRVALDDGQFPAWRTRLPVLVVHSHSPPGAHRVPGPDVGVPG